METKIYIRSWVLDHLLGEGTTGEVWKASKDGRVVAIKLFHSYLEDEIKEELITLKRLDHPNIVKGISYGQFRGNYYMVMEYVDGRPLSAVDPNQLDRNVIESIIRQLTGAMNYAHQKGIIHRDLKPQNILIRDDFQVKILDYGVAAQVTDDLRSRLVEGSYLYMAPEQLAGKINIQNDLWAFGVTLFEWLTGKHPYPSNTLGELSKQLMLSETPFPHKENGHISYKISYILNKCLKKNIEERYSGFDEILKDLQHDPTHNFQSQWLSNKNANELLEFIMRRWRRVRFLMNIIYLFVLSLIAGLFWWKPFYMSVSFLDKEDWQFIYIFITVALVVGWVAALELLNQRFKKTHQQILPKDLRVLAFFSSDSVFVRFIQQLENVYDFNKWRNLQISYLVKQNKYSLANRIAGNLLKKNPNALTALSFFAVENMERGNMKKAYQFCQYILRINPDNAAGMFFSKMFSLQGTSDELLHKDALKDTLFREDKDRPYENRSNKTSIAISIAKNGSARIPVILENVNFCLQSSPGELILEEHYLTLKTEGSKTLDGAMPSASHSFRRGVSIERGKISYYATKNLVLLNKNYVAPLNIKGFYPPLGEHSFPINKKIYTPEKAKALTAFTFTLSYQDINEVALFGKWVQFSRGQASFGFSFEHQIQQDELVSWLKDRKKETARIPIKFNRLQKIKTLSILTNIVVFSLLAFVLFILLSFVPNRGGGVDYLFPVLMIALLIPFYFVFRILLRFFSQKTEKIIEGLRYSMLRAFRNYIFPRRNDQWLELKEKDPFLECCRLLFQHSRVPLTDEEKEQVEVHFIHNSVEAFPFRLDFKEQLITVMWEEPKSLSFEKITSIVFSKKGLYLIQNGTVWHYEPLQSEYFDQYIPHLLRAFSYQFTFSENNPVNI